MVRSADFIVYIVNRKLFLERNVAVEFLKVIFLCPELHGYFRTWDNQIKTGGLDLYHRKYVFVIWVNQLFKY